MKKIFVTSGAGYICSHVVTDARGAGYDVLVYDNLSNGHRESVLRKAGGGLPGACGGQYKNKECVEMDSKI